MLFRIVIRKVGREKCIKISNGIQVMQVEGLASAVSRYLSYLSVSLSAVAFVLGILVAFGGIIADDTGRIGYGLEEGSVNSYASWVLFVFIFVIGGCCAVIMGVNYLKMRDKISFALFLSTVPIAYSLGVMFNNAIHNMIDTTLAVNSMYRGGGYESIFIGLSCMLASSIIISFFVIRSKEIERYMLVVMGGLFSFIFAGAYAIPQEYWYAKSVIILITVPLIIMLKNENEARKNSELHKDASMELSRVNEIVNHAKEDGVYTDIVMEKLREAEQLLSKHMETDSKELVKGGVRAIGLASAGSFAMFLIYAGILCIYDSERIFSDSQKMAFGLVGALLTLSFAFVVFRPATSRPTLGLIAGILVGIVSVIFYLIESMLLANIILFISTPVLAFALAQTDKSKKIFVEKFFGNGVSFFFCAVSIIMLFFAVNIASYAAGGSAEKALEPLVRDKMYAGILIFVFSLIFAIALGVKLYKETGKGGIIAIISGLGAVLVVVLLKDTVGIGSFGIGILLSMVLVVVAESGAKTYVYFPKREEKKVEMNLKMSEIFTNAKQMVLSAEKEINELTIKYSIATSAYNQASVSANEAARLGFNPNVLENVREMMKKGRYEDAEKKAKEIEANAKDVIQKHEIAIEAISNAQSAIEKAKEIGADYANAHEILVESMKCIDNYKFVDGKELAEKAKRVAEERIDGYKRASEAIEKAKNEIEKAKNAGAEVTQPLDILTRAKSSINENDYEKAYSLACEAYEFGKRIYESFTKAVALIANAQSEVATLKKVGCDAAKPEDLLAKATLAMEYNEYENATKHASESISESKSILEKFERAVAAIKSAEELFSSLKSRGIDTARSALFLKQAKAEMQASDLERGLDYEKALNLAKQSIEEGKKVEEAYNNAVEMMKKASEMLESVKGEGIDVREAESLLSKSEKEQRLMSYNSAYEWAKKSIEMLEKKKKEYTDALEAINTAKSQLESAISEGLAGDEAKKKLESANEALSKMEYLSAIEFTKECINQINKVRELKINAEKIIEEAEKAIADARAEKVDVSAAEKAIVSAKNALASGNYATALETGKKVKTDAEIRLKSFKGASEEIANARKYIEEIMELGGDAAKVTELLGQAQNVLKTDVVKGYELAKSCVEKASKQKQAISYVKNCKSRIDALQQKGTDVSKLSNVLWLADSFMRKGEFDKVINYAQKLEKLIENLEKQ